jgi:YgiT-type zinc finger domain-containing protein
MKYIEKCPRCAGAVDEKEVTEILYGGINTAFLKVKVKICLLCGERLYTPEVIRQFEQIEAKLERQETEDFQPVGQSFEVELGGQNPT